MNGAPTLLIPTWSLIWGLLALTLPTLMPPLVGGHLQLVHDTDFRNVWVRDRPHCSSGIYSVCSLGPCGSSGLCSTVNYKLPKHTPRSPCS